MLLAPNPSAPDAVAEEPPTLTATVPIKVRLALGNRNVMVQNTLPKQSGWP